jgi:uncharacterized damage-inducible protein DinB
MNTGIASLIDLDRELRVTRKVLERLPENQFDWKVHEKSMSLGRLAMHVATLPQWLHGTLAEDELDLSTPPQLPTEAKDRATLLRTFDDGAKLATDALAQLDEPAMLQTWTMRHGEKVLYAAPRAVVARVWCVNHLIHHRAQLCVYLRILGEPVPAVYFNSADEPEWVFD